MNKKIIIPIAALTLTGAALLSVRQALAQENSSHTSIVQKIAQKFGLNEADVQKVFDEERQEHINQMKAKYEEKLTQAVEEGKLTDAQKQLILAKRTEMETQRESQKDEFQNMTPEQRKTDMEAKRLELENWAKQNNIDVQYLFGGKPMGKGHGRGMMMR